MSVIVDSKFEQWKAHLLDMSKRNRLLFFKNVRRGNVQITEPNANEIFDWLVRGGKKLVFAQHPTPLPDIDIESEQAVDTQATVTCKITLRPGEICTSLADQQLAITLYNIRSKSRMALQEQGVNVLYLAFGMLKWHETKVSTEEIQSPLILVPVELDRGSIAKPYTLELLDEDILINPTTAYRMQKGYGLSFPQLPEDWENYSLAQTLARIEELVQHEPRWSVLPQVHLGLFSFEKLVMLKDLELHANQAKEHPIIAAIAGDFDQARVIPSDVPSVAELDRRVSPQDTFQVLDADSSQQEAIALAKRDASLVIQGPPGTGKSQTIANIIAERLAQGKRVLFVSEKMAALEVVYKRLQECGLDEFCLEAHSHKGSKSAIIAQLGKSLNSTLPNSSPSFESELEQVSETRTRLNEYVNALHTTRMPLDKSVFQVHGLLASLHEASDITFPLTNILRLDANGFAQIERELDRLVAMSEVWDKYEGHPWRDTLVQDFSFHTQSEIRDHFGEFIKCLDRLEATASDLAQAIGVKSPENLAKARWLGELASLVIKTPYPPMDWFKGQDLARIRQSANQAREMYADYLNHANELMQVSSIALVEASDLPDMVSRFETTYKSSWRFLNSNYRQDMKKIREISIVQPKVGYEEMLRILKLALHTRAKQARIEAHRAEHQQLFGDLFKGTNTHWEAIFSALDWTGQLVRCLGDKEPGDQLLDLVCRRSNRIEFLRVPIAVFQDVLQETERQVSFLAGVFPMDRVRVDGVRYDYASFDPLREYTRFRLNRVGDLMKWISFQSAWKGCEQLGLGFFLEAAKRDGISSDKISAAFRKRFYRMWLDAVYAQDPALSGFSGDQHNKLIEHFRQVDGAQVGYARKRLIAKLAANRPKSSWLEAPSSEVTLLRRELEKKKRHKPIRRLFAEISNLLLTLKPCLMMSPLSVSRFLSAGKFEFDTIIFDEASQICPEDAISAIMRGKQVIVAGDRHQLPPTPFFRSLGIDFDEWDGEETGEVLQSILQECAVFMPSQMLKWHYRSRRESLIAFSNHYIYDDQLITFPSPQLDSDHFGIEFVYVPDGVYERGTTRKNRGEAEQVADLVYRHFVEFGDRRSLGIVTFSEAQREAIDKDIERLARTNPAFETFVNQKGLEAFFIKNLENVQGDERDVIFFSMGYGKDALGKITMNFGPLNGEDGIRRLNVAMTRARYQVKFVSSILPEDIDADHPNKGVQLLRRYMEYARQRGNQVLQTKPDVSQTEETEFRFEEAVCSALTERGLAIQKRIGCSGYRIDLAILDANGLGRYLLAIEGDGESYRSAKTARDRDRLRQQILEGLGWQVHRVWSRDWIIDPNAEVRKILNAVDQAQASKNQFRVSQSQFSLPASSEPEITDDQTAHLAMEQNGLAVSGLMPQGVKTYVPFSFPRQGEPEQFYRSTQDLVQVLRQVVEQEGPIHMDGACRRVAECWGIAKIGNRIKSQIVDAANGLAEEKQIQIRDQFLWPMSQPQILVRRPPAGENPRPIEEIAIEEIAQAIYLCLCDAFSLSEEDLVLLSARLLGYERAGERVRERISLATEQLVLHGLVVNTEQKIELVHKRV